MGARRGGASRAAAAWLDGPREAEAPTVPPLPVSFRSLRHGAPRFFGLDT
jgi:hypothetical protein